MHRPRCQQRPQRDLGRADGAHLQKHRHPLHTERRTAQRAGPQPGAGGLIAAGTHFQQHGGQRRPRLWQQCPAPCRQQPEVQHKAAELQVGHCRLRDHRVQCGQRNGFPLRGWSLPGPALHPAQHRRREVSRQQLGRKQPHPHRAAAQHLLPYREDDKGRPAAHTGGQQRRGLPGGELTGAHGFGRSHRRRCKAPQGPNEQHAARALCPDAHEPRRRPEHKAQPLPGPAACRQRRYDEERKQRYQQRPAAQPQPRLQGIGTALRRGKHQKRRVPCQRQQHAPPEIPASIHNSALRIHIYVAARRGQNCGMGGNGMCAKRKKRLLPQSWLALLFRQPPQGFYHAPAVYLSGGRMEVEHFCRILAYSPDRLCLQMPHGRLTIYGDGLKIVTLTASRLTLRGRFVRTDFADD